MKEEWITENVERAFCKERNLPYPIPEGEHDAADLPTHMGLEDAINLLHASGEAAGLTTFESSSYHLTTGERTYHARVVSKNERCDSCDKNCKRAFEVDFCEWDTESRLHALLRAVDAIVEYKPEAFA